MVVVDTAGVETGPGTEAVTVMADLARSDLVGAAFLFFYLDNLLKTGMIMIIIKKDYIIVISKLTSMIFA